MYKDKFNMEIKDNIAYAKRNIVDSIYSSAKIDNLNITFPETKTILEKGVLENADISVVNTILNLKHAWQFILSNLNEEINLDFICKVHYEVAKDDALFWGVLRTGNVGISGTEYIPPIPKEIEVEKTLEEYNSNENITERALKRMLYMMKSQLFWDGNKRTAMIIANKDLISHGKGILNIKNKDLLEFNTLLNKFYSSFDEENKENLLNMLHEKSIEGINSRIMRR